MAPNPLPTVLVVPRWYERATTDTLPTCVTTCLATGQLGTCTSLTDYACICNSATYQQSVANCWGASCNATEIATGQAYSEAGCASLGYTITATYSPQTSTIGGSNGTSVTNGTSSATNGTSTATNSTSGGSPATTDTSTAPVIYSSASVTISAIMSTVCSLLLAGALLLGILSCRSRMRRNQAVSQSRSWTHAGSQADTKNGARSGAGARSGGFGSRAMRSHDPTATFASDMHGATSSANYGLTSADYGEMSRNTGRSVGFSLNRGGNSTGFTNRLTLGDDAGETSYATGTGEEWEMEDKSAKDTEGESPTTPTTRMGSEADFHGSTTHLNVNILTKGDGSSEPHAV